MCVCVCRVDCCGCGCSDSGLMSEFSGFVHVGFCVVVSSRSFFVVVISDSLTVCDDAMAELHEYASCRDDGDLTRSIGEWNHFLAYQVFLLGLGGDYFTKISIPEEEEI